MKLLTRVKILAMSTPKAKLESDLRAKGDVIFEHLMKLYLFPDNQSVPHWKQEVYAALNNVPRLKPKNKFPSKKLIMSNVYETWYDVLDGFISRIEEDYGIVDWKNFMYDEFDGMVYKYFDELSDSLSKVGHVKSSEVYLMLDNAGF